MKCEFGFCINCEKEISSACVQCGTRRINDQYTEVALPMTNGSKMVVGVCLDCADKVFHADKNALMDAVKSAWIREHHKAKRPHEILLKHEETVKDLAFV